MPRSIKDILPENDYAGRLGLGLVLIIASQMMTKFDGVIFMVLRWGFVLMAVVNYAVVLILYQEQKRKKIQSKEDQKE